MTDTAAAPGPAWLEALARGAIGIAGLSLVGVVIVQAWQVVARYVLNDSPGWTEPVAVLLLNTAMSFGAAAAVHGQQHFSFPLLLARLSPGPARIAQALGTLAVAGFGAALAWWGAILLLDGLPVRMAGARLPQSAAFLPMSLGGALIVVFALSRLLRNRHGEEH